MAERLVSHHATAKLKIQECGPKKIESTQDTERGQRRLVPETDHDRDAQNADTEQDQPPKDDGEEDALKLPSPLQSELHGEQIRAGSNNVQKARKRPIQGRSDPLFMAFSRLVHHRAYLRVTKTPMRRPTPKAMPMDS
jgi:hypothetical protein